VERRGEIDAFGILTLPISYPSLLQSGYAAAIDTIFKCQMTDGKLEMTGHAMRSALWPYAFLLLEKQKI
jgi:hypothetical protein